MPQDNEIYKFLKANNLTTKDEKSFLNEYSDSSKAKELFGFFQSNNLTTKDFNSFYDTYLKKKEPSVSLGTQSPSKSETIDIQGGLTPLGGAASSITEITPTSKTTFDTGVTEGEYDQVAVDKATPFIRGILQGELANKLALNQTPNPKQISEIASISKRLQDVGATDAQNRFDAEGFSLFKNEPTKGVEFLFETIGNSLASLAVAGSRTVPAGVAVGAGGGSVVPGIGTMAGAGMGAIAGLSAAGLNLSTSQKILDVLRETGIDISDEQKLTSAFQDEKLMAKAREKALKYGVPIFLFDLASGGVAGKLSANAVGKPLAKKFLAGTGEVGIQSLFGGAGEAAGQLASEGKIDWRDVGVEALASIATDVPEIALGAARRIPRKNASSNNKTLATQVAVLGKEAGVEDAKINLDRDFNNGVIDETEYNEGLQFIEKAAAINETIPETVKGENRGKIIELIDERQRLEEELNQREEEKKKVDVSFHSWIDELNKDVTTRIKEINGEIEKIASKKQKDETIETTEVPIETETEITDIETPTETIRTTEVTEEKDPKQKLIDEEKGVYKIGENTYGNLDLKGNDRELWMMPYKESEATESGMGVTEKGELGQSLDVKRLQKNLIQDALNEGKYEKAISEGNMSPAYAAKIIRSAGLEVPQDILIDEALQLNPPAKKEAEPVQEVINSDFNFKTEKGNFLEIDKEFYPILPEEKDFVNININNSKGEKLGDILLNKTKEGYTIEHAGLIVKNQRKGFGKDAYITLIKKLDKPLISGRTDIEEGFSEDARGLWESLSRDGYAEYNEKEKRYYSIKPKQNAIQKPSTESLLQSQQEEIGETGSGRERVEQGEQREETTQAQQEKEVGSNEEIVEPPQPPKPPKEETKEGDKPFKTDNKSILTRIYQSENITPSVKEKFKDKLKYKVSSQDEARSIAKGILKEYDIDESVSLAEAGKFDGDVNSFIFAEALDKTFQSELDAKTPQEKALFAEKWADIAMRYDDTARDKGRFIAAIADFYRKSPLGIKIAEEARRSDDFKKWFKNKEEGYKEVFEEITKEPEFQEYVKGEVQKELKKERAEFRKERRKKIEDAFDSFKVNKDALYAIPIPPNIYNGAVEAMKQAFLAGESIANAVEVAVEKISAEIKDWDKDKFRKEYQERLSKIDKYKKTPEELPQDKKEKILAKFRNKLKGLSEKEKEEVIRKSFKKLVENGALEYDDFKKIIAETIGLGEMTAEETAIIQQLVKDINDVEELVNAIRQEGARNLDNLKKYRDAKIKAEKSATKLGQLVYNKPNIVNRLLSVMQLNTLGIPSLVNNPIFNIANQAVVRFPIGLQLTILDQILYNASKVTNRIFGTGLLLPQNNVALSQKEFTKKLWQGSKQSTEQLFTGLTNKDYFQKEVYSSQIHPFTSAKELWDYAFKGKKLTPAQVADKSIQATVGLPAEIVARVLNIGDKPQRYAAEGAQAAVFAKNLGIKNVVDYEYFLEFPKEEAYRVYKQQGLSDEVAMKKAEELQSSIIKQGEESVFQQDNLLNDAINNAFKAPEKYGAVPGAIAETIKKFNLPFLKIPLNAFWSYFNIVNPEVAFLQSATYAVKAIKTKSASDIQQAKKWAAHGTTGIALMAIGASLAKEGIINADNEDETTKKERMGEQQYEQQKSINITKLKAYLNGQDPSKVENGLNIDLKWLGVIGNVLNIQAAKLEEMTPEQKEKGMSYMEDLLNTMTLSGNELIDNGVFSNASGLLTAIKKGGGFADQYFLNLINMGTNIVQPAMFAQISRAQLPYYSQQKADTFFGQVENSMLSRSGLLRTLTGKYPPSKVSIWGDRMDRSGNILMKLFSVSKSKKDNFAQPIYEDYRRTNNTKFFPPSVKPEINKQKLNTEQARQLEILIGQARKSLIAPYIHDGAILEGYDEVYSKLSDEDKIKALEIIYEQGFNMGKEEFIRLYPQFGEPEPTEDDILKKTENEIRKRVFRQTIKTP